MNKFYIWMEIDNAKITQRLVALWSKQYVCNKTLNYALYIYSGFDDKKFVTSCEIWNKMKEKN